MSIYLEILDETLRAGWGMLPEKLLQKHLQFIIEQQQSDGGFAGRMGGSDPYYTDFALRVVTIISPDNPTIAAAKDYINNLSNTPPADVIELFNRANISRLLGQKVILENDILTHQVCPGGLARKGENTVSAYTTFLGELARQIVDENIFAYSPDAIWKLKCADGGFADTAGEDIGQTNPTAAATALITMAGGTIGDDTAKFLSNMQSPASGLRAHELADADLLSTFTGMMTLIQSNNLNRLNLPAIARFTATCADPEGGFAACPDDTPDVEYTYYGLAVLGLLRGLMG
ncbi:MAG: prenyltransferase/squalene oxidase repeat-containing protein [bacterium]